MNRGGSSGFLSRLTVTVLSVCCLGMTATHAQDAPRPTVTKAFDLFQRYPNSVPVGTEVVFLPVAGSARAQQIVNRGLQVRVFSLGDDEDRPQPLAVKDGCEMYLSVVHRLSATAAGAVRFQTVDHTWLTLTNSLSSVKSGRYYLVFEQLGGEDQHFRIRRGTDANQYFGSGFLLQVQPDATVSHARVREEYLKRRNLLGTLYTDAERGAGRPCYRYEPVRAAREDETQLAQGELQPCADGSDPQAAQDPTEGSALRELTSATSSPASPSRSAPAPSPGAASPA